MSRKIPLIIDTDPGIDDAAAIAIALFDETLNVRLITTVSGNVSLDKVTKNTLKLLKYFGKEEIPVAAGASEPLIREAIDAEEVHGKSGMEGFDFEEPDLKVLNKNAAEAMRDLITESKEKITILAIGPLTNIALLLKTFPEVKGNIEEIIFMGGSASRGNSGVMTEFNMGVDPEAAHIVLHSGLKITMVGLDIGLKALIYPEDRKKIREAGKTGFMLSALFDRYRGDKEGKGIRMCDSTAIAYLLRPDMFKTVNTYIGVELEGKYTAGCTLVDFEGYLGREANADVCTDVDADEFRKWLAEAIEKCI